MGFGSSGGISPSSRCCSQKIFTIFALQRVFSENKGGRFRSSRRYPTSYPFEIFRYSFPNEPRPHEYREGFFWGKEVDLLAAGARTYRICSSVVL